MGHRRAPQVDTDLDTIWYFVATGSGNLEIADRVVDSITEKFYLLAEHPYIGRDRSSDLRPGIRSFVAGEYLILYRLFESDVEVLRVLRGSRDIEAVFR